MRSPKTIGVLSLLLATICFAQEPFHNSLAWRAQQWVSGSSCTNPFPIDTFIYYTNVLADLDGLDGDCPWDGAYGAHTYETLPALVHVDLFETYSAGADLDGLHDGPSWFWPYAVHFDFNNRTNLWGTLVAQYVGFDYATNAGVPTWPDRSVNHFNLTNLMAQSFWPTTVANGVNTNTVVSFNGASLTNHLRSAQYTNTAAAEYFIVCKLVSHGTAGNDMFIDGNEDGAAFQVLYRDKVVDKYQMYQGALLGSTAALTNAWFVMDAIFTGGATSAIFTNNVTGAAGNAGSAACSALLVGSALAGGAYYSPTTIQIAEILAYQGNLRTAIRSNVWYELKSVYGL